MGEIFKCIEANQGCTVTEIHEKTGISKTEITRYLKKEKFEFRNLEFMLRLRKRNRKYYKRLLSEARYVVRNGVKGFYINTSKYELFDIFCFRLGSNLSVDNNGRAYLFDFLNNADETAKTVNVLPIGTLPKPVSEDD